MTKQRESWLERLRAAIAASGLSQAALAKQAGTTQAQVSRILTGKRIPNIETAEKIGRVVGIDLAEIPRQESLDT